MSAISASFAASSRVIPCPVVWVGCTIPIGLPSKGALVQSWPTLYARIDLEPTGEAEIVPFKPRAVAPPNPPAAQIQSGRRWRLKD